MSKAFYCPDCDTYFVTGGSGSVIMTYATFGGTISEIAIGGGGILDRHTQEDGFLIQDNVVDSKICPYCYSWNTKGKSDNDKSKALFHFGKKVDQFRYDIERIENLCEALPPTCILEKGYFSDLSSADCRSALMEMHKVLTFGISIDEIKKLPYRFNRDLIIRDNKTRTVWFLTKGPDQKGKIRFSLKVEDGVIWYSKDGVDYISKEEVLNQKKEWKDFIKNTYEVFHSYSAVIDFYQHVQTE